MDSRAALLRWRGVAGMPERCLLRRHKRCVDRHAFVQRSTFARTLISRPPLSVTKNPLGTPLCSSSVEEHSATKISRSASLIDSGEEEDFEFGGGDIGLKASTKSRAVYEVLRVDSEGRNRRIYVKRRDLLRSHGLKPRDLRRVDPFWDKPQSTHSIVIKESAFLVSLLGVRALVAEDRLLLFDPENPAARKFLAFVTPRLRTAAGKALIRHMHFESTAAAMINGAPHGSQGAPLPTPFELEVLEGILVVALSQLDAELSNLTKQAAKVLSAVPAEVNPLDLEQLRRTKQSCVELESKSEALRWDLDTLLSHSLRDVSDRELLEEILDDEDELVRLNLSSRPARENRIRLRERKRLQFDQGYVLEPYQPLHAPTIHVRLCRSPMQYQNAEDALAEMDDEEEEEREMEEVEDLLEYYMQRAAGVQSEAERVLAGVASLQLLCLTLLCQAHVI